MFDGFSLLAVGNNADAFGGTSGTFGLGIFEKKEEVDVVGVGLGTSVGTVGAAETGGGGRVTAG